MAVLYKYHQHVPLIMELIHFRACLLWNKLPSSLKESQSLPEFKHKIKTIGKIECSCTICRSR